MVFNQKINLLYFQLLIGENYNLVSIKYIKLLQKIKIFYLNLIMNN
jgi:hypothetical protein